MESMTAYWESLTGLQKTYLMFAVISSVLLIFRVFLQIIGIGDTDVDADFDIADGDVPDVGATGGASLHLFSIQGLSGFFLMFGLVGLTLSKEAGWHDVFSSFGGFVAGVIMMVIIAKLTTFMMGLQSSGNVKITNAIGQEGTVYLRIPANEAGKVQVTVQERLRIYEAVSENKEEIPTGDHVEVVGIFSGDVLVVKKV